VRLVAPAGVPPERPLRPSPDLDANATAEREREREKELGL
jgi:hypothetical protein